MSALRRTQIYGIIPEAAPCLHHPTQLRSFECRRNLYHLSNSRGSVPLTQDYNNIFRLSVGVPDHSSESCREGQKMIGFIVIISQRGVCKS